MTELGAPEVDDLNGQIIAEFPDSAYQRALLAVTELVTDRDH